MIRDDQQLEDRGRCVKGGVGPCKGKLSASHWFGG